jgi:Tfp pilus assembly protein PilO
MLGLELKSKTITIAILVVAVLGIGYFVLYPQWTKMSQAQAELDRVKQENAAYNESLSRMQTFLDKHETYGEESVVAGQTLPLKNMNLPEFINNVADLAKMGGVVFSTLDVPDIAAASTQGTKVNAEYSVQTQEVGLSVSGTYPAIKSFILLLETNLRLIDVEQVSFTTSPGEDLIRALIKVKTYFQK